MGMPLPRQATHGGPTKKRVCSYKKLQTLCLYRGAGTRIRTRDTRIFSPMLYRLSYPGKKVAIIY